MSNSAECRNEPAGHTGERERRAEARPTAPTPCGSDFSPTAFEQCEAKIVGLKPDPQRPGKKKRSASRAPSPLPKIVFGYFFAGAAALAGAAPAFAAGAAGVAGGICAGVTALPFAFISAK